MRLALLALAAAGLPATYAWGAAGHEIVATIAQIYLHPSVLPILCDILHPAAAPSSSALPPCHLAPVAAWADKVRRQPQYRYTASLHYVGALDDYPSATCAFPGDRGWAGKRDANVLGAVKNMTGVLAEYVDGVRDRAGAEEALKFLVHYVGDMHMPLHLTGRDRGGNGDKVLFDGRVTNLHSLWDSLLIAQALRTVPSNYTRRFPRDSSAIAIEPHLRGTIYDAYVRRVFYEGFGTGTGPAAADGRFADEYHDWLDCPQLDSGNTSSGGGSLWDRVQAFLGVQRASLRGDTVEDGWDDDVLCPYAWAKELHSLNCDLPVWPRELDEPRYRRAALAADHAMGAEAEQEPWSTSGRRPNPHPDLLELDTPEYAGKIRSGWVVERLLAMAGVRLAGILNGLFLDDDDSGSDVTLVHFPIVRI